MKNLLTLVALVLFAAGATAQNAPAAATPKAAWPEKDAFHKVMAQTFHPAEEGNFEPIRTRSQEMLDKALAWMNSTPPADYNNEQIRSTLQTMVRQIRELNQKINHSNTKPTDQELLTDLTKIHDTFHQIVGLCKPGEHGHDHGHDHSDPNHKH